MIANTFMGVLLLVPLIVVAGRNLIAALSSRDATSRSNVNDHGVLRIIVRNQAPRTTTR